MRKPKKKIELDKKLTEVGQYGEDDVEDLEIIEEEEERYAMSIGKFIISFSYLEDSVDSSLAGLINERTHQPGYRVIRYLSFRDKADLLRDEYSALIRGVVNSKKDKLRLLGQLSTLHNKLAELSEFRNKVAHANWCSLDKDGFVRTKTVENKEGYGMSFQRIKMSPSVLVKFVRQNNSLSGKFYPFTEKIWESHRKEEAKRYNKAI